MQVPAHRAFTLFLSLLMFAGAASAATSLWLHVKVDEGDGAKVTVNLPISMIERALPLIPGEHFQDGRIIVDHMEVSAEEVREMWAEIKNSPDMTFVSVEEADESVKVWYEGNFLFVNVIEDDGEEKVEVRLPMQVVDALLSGDGEEFDVHAAVEALVEEGEGELVTIRDDDDQVRVWVDRIAEAD